MDVDVDVDEDEDGDEDEGECGSNRCDGLDHYNLVVCSLFCFLFLCL